MAFQLIHEGEANMIVRAALRGAEDAPSVTQALHRILDELRSTRNYVVTEMFCGGVGAEAEEAEIGERMDVLASLESAIETELGLNVQR